MDSGNQITRSVHYHNTLSTLPSNDSPAVFKSINKKLDFIEKYSRNNFRWSYKGSPTLLLGATDTDHLFQWSGEKLESHLDELVSADGNYVRNT